ncbi:SIR2 family protein [Mycoplasma sp. 480]|uniref:SIR2 family protein n=1 Tax=Mycoplasma sp. 480 TaxID=3440155 RepID=UPI003F510173
MDKKNLKDFINKKNFNDNLPVLFIGSGFSKRYLVKSYTWRELLETIYKELLESTSKLSQEEKENLFLELVYKYKNDYSLIAEEMEKEFNSLVKIDQIGKWKEINEDFYKNYLKEEKWISRFKLFIKNKLEKFEINEDSYKEEINLFQKASQYFYCIITTNYDKLLETILNDKKINTEDNIKFKPLIGDKIVFEKDVGSIYKIHGCVTSPEDIIITKSDYMRFENEYKLIKSRILSLFIKQPVIFLGYAINDSNIKNMLKIIYEYAKNNIKDKEKILKNIENNFLFVEYSKEKRKTSEFETIEKYNIKFENNEEITISKIKTDKYKKIFDSIIQAGFSRKTAEISRVYDSITNSNSNNEGFIKVIYGTSLDLIKNYFEIIEQKQKIDYLKHIDQIWKSKNEIISSFGFYYLNINRKKIEPFLKRQYDKLNNYINKENNRKSIEKAEKTIEEIIKKNSEFSISFVNKNHKLWNKSKMFFIIFVSIFNDKLELQKVNKWLKKGLKNFVEQKIKNEKIMIKNLEFSVTNFKYLLSIYDFKKYASDDWKDRLKILKNKKKVG